MHGHFHLTSVRRLFAIVLALSVLFAPAVTVAVMAAAPHQDMQMMEAGHCQAAPSSAGHHDRMDGKGCCISMCTAIAVAPSTPADTRLLRQEGVEFALPKTYHGLHGEIATPPPRFA